PRFVLGRHPGKDRRRAGGGRQAGVVEGIDVGAGQGSAGGQPEVGADLLGDHRVVPGGDLYGDAERCQSAQRVGGAGFGWVEEDQEAVEVQVVFVGGGERGRRRRAAGDRDDAAAGGELQLQGGLGGVR